MTIAVSTQTRPTPDLVVLVGGQSLADFLTYTGAGDAFIAALRTHSDTPDLSGALATAGGNTYADSAINTAITSVNLQHKELQAVLNNVVNSHNALLTQLQANGLIQAN